MLKLNYLLLSVVFFLSLNTISAQTDFATLINKDYYGISYFGFKGFQVFDLDNDGKQEIIAAINQTSSYVAIYNYDGTEYQRKWISKIYLKGIQGLYVAKTNDSDANYSIYVLNNLNKVEVYDATTYSLKESYTLEFGEVRDIAIDNVDNTASKELVIIGEFGLKVFNLATKQLVWTLTDIKGGEVEIADLDNDGKKEIITAPLGFETTPKLNVLDAFNKTTKWSSDKVFKNIEIFDANKDGFNDIVGNTGSEILYIDSKNQVAKVILTAFNDYQRGFYVGDADKDGNPEIIVMASAGSMYCYDLSGNQKWYYRTNDDFTTAMFVTDIDRDGKSEIIRGNTNHLLINDYATRDQEFGTLRSNGSPAFGIGDIDNDNKPDLVLSNSYYQPQSAFSGQYPKGYIRNYELTNLKITKSTLLPFNSIDQMPVKSIGRSRSKTKMEIATDYGIYDALTHALLFDASIFGGTSNSFTPMKFVDLNNDGIDELLVSDTKKFEVYKWTGTKYQVDFEFPIEIGSQMFSVAISNIDADTAKEVLSVDYFGKLNIYDAKTHLLEWRSNAIRASCVGVVDLNLDKKLEIVIGTDDGYIITLDAATKAEISKIFISGASGLRVYDLKFVNLDLTPNPEVVIVQSRNITVLTSGFTAYWEMPDEYDYLVSDKTSIEFLDLDNDQYKELYFANSVGLFVFKLNQKYQNATSIIPTIVDNLFKYYPNPSSGFIEINLSEQMEGNLEIINNEGQSILSKRIAVTDSKIELNLSDFADGFYMLLLKTAKGISAKKMIISKK
jgi:Secretion system C-terminal sorting domain